MKQGGKLRAGYGGALLARLAEDLSARFGRGFSRFNLGRFRQFYLATPTAQMRAIASLGSPILVFRLEAGQAPFTRQPGDPNNDVFTHSTEFTRQ